jgi:peptidylprolyl isomerase
MGIMSQAEHGDTVTVHYTGKLDDGTVFDTSIERDALRFTIGEGQIISGFEVATLGMSPGEAKTINIPMNEAYGPHREELILVVDREQFPPDLNPEVNQQLQMSHADGEVMVAIVTDVSESQVTLDANHPLAGQDLTFDIQLVEIC